MFTKKIYVSDEVDDLLGKFIQFDLTNFNRKHKRVLLEHLSLHYCVIEELGDDFTYFLVPYSTDWSQFFQAISQLLATLGYRIKLLN